METIQEKYKRIRPLIKDGDLVLFHGTKLLAKIIQHCDRDRIYPGSDNWLIKLLGWKQYKAAYFNHIGIVMESHNGLFILDSQSNGVESDRLSERINDYKNGDFCIIQSIEELGIDEEMEKLFAREDMTDVLYDYENGFKELLNRKFGWNLKIKPNDKKDICSDFVYEYALKTKMICPFENRVAFPQDYVRFRNEKETILIGC